MVLRNVVPRQGTETIDRKDKYSEQLIEKCSSPTGDGNGLRAMNRIRKEWQLRNVVPRQGTETDWTS